MPKKFLLIFILALTLFFCESSWQKRQAEKEAQEQRKQELYETYDDLFKAFLTNTNAELGKEVVRYEEISPGLFPKKVTFKGSYRDVGKWVGLMARKHGISPHLRTEENREINEKIEKMYQKIFPPFLERARGIAAVYSLNLEDLDLRHIENGFTGTLWWQLFKYDEFLELTRFSSQTSSENCSVMSYYIEDEKRQLVGRNFDIWDDRPHFLVESHLQGVYRTAGMTCYQLQNKIMDGINETGLFMGIASNTFPAKYKEGYANEPYPEVPAICSPRLIRVILDCCATVEQALDLISKVRIWFPDELQHFLIADVLGNSAVIEFDKNKNLHVFPRFETYQVMTNTAFMEGLDYVYDHCPRFRRATNLCAEGVNSMEEFWEVVCAIQQRGSIKSIWTSRADLKKLKYDARFWSEDWEVPHVISLKD